MASRPHRSRARLCAAALALWAAAVLALTLGSGLAALVCGAPLARHAANWRPFVSIINQLRWGTRSQIWRQLGGNLLLFFPLGLLAPSVWPRLRRFVPALLCAAAGSAAIEGAQYFLGRMTDVDDLLLNTAGAGLGWLCWFLFCRGRR